MYLSTVNNLFPKILKNKHPRYFRSYSNICKNYIYIFRVLEFICVYWKTVSMIENPSKENLRAVIQFLSLMSVNLWKFIQWKLYMLTTQHTAVVQWCNKFKEENPFDLSWILSVSMATVHFIILGYRIAAFDALSTSSVFLHQTVAEMSLGIITTKQNLNDRVCTIFEKWKDANGRERIGDHFFNTTVRYSCISKNLVLTSTLTEMQTP